MSTVNPPPGSNNSSAVGRGNGPGRSEPGDVSEARAPTGEGPVSRGTETGPGNPARSSVSLSETARQVAEIEAGIDRSPAFDEDKVAALREAISSGAYTIDTERLATRIMALELGS